MTTFSRRDVMQLFGAGALALAGPMAGRRAMAQDRSKELNILCWEGYNSAQVLDPFRTEHGATVRAESLTNDPTMINRLRAGETNVWDLINVNNPWARKIMLPEGLIKPLDRARFEPYFETMLPPFHPPYRWAMSEDGSELIGLAQRFGPYSFVVNTDKISREAAEDQGWDLWNDPANAGKYGILESDDWNVFNIFMIAGIDPFSEHTPEEMTKFHETAKRVFAGRGDGRRHRHHEPVADLGRDRLPPRPGAPIRCRRREPTASRTCARSRRSRARSRARAASPGSRSPRLVNNPNLSPLAEEFLSLRAAAGRGAYRRLRRGHLQPGHQMGDPACFDLFTAEELDAIQWDSLEEEMARSIEYDIVPDYDAALDLMTAAKRARG